MMMLLSALLALGTLGSRVASDEASGWARSQPILVTRGRTGILQNQVNGVGLENGFETLPPSPNSNRSSFENPESTIGKPSMPT
jgi:hypothetical protein